MKILITYPFGLGGVCQTELRQLGFSPVKKGYALMVNNMQRKDVYRINLWSRVANKVFVVLAEQKVMDFDALFDLISSLDWKQYIGSGHGVRVLAHSRESQLASTRTIQSIVHKSILTQLTGSREKHWEVDERKSTIEISVDIYKDMATIMINTSGASLHERGYRTEQGDAPLKENIAAGLLLLAGWDKKSPLYDPFCGSGTICIEAAMMAAGIAPWLLRTFAFEEFGSFDGLLYGMLCDEATSRKLKSAGNVTSRNKWQWMTRSIGDTKHDDTYTSHIRSKWQVMLFGSDIDASVLEKAQANAIRAGVGDMVDFQEKHFLDREFRIQISDYRLQTTDSGLQEWDTIDPGPAYRRQVATSARLPRNDSKVWCVTNPPYGVRLWQESEELVEDLLVTYSKYSLLGWFLLLRGLQAPGFSCIDLLNGQQEVCFYRR